MLNSISVAFRVALAYGILKVSSAAGQGHCNGPITIGEVTAVRVSPDPQAARDVQLTMTSEYKLIPYFVYDDIQVLFQEDGSGIIARKSRRGDEFHFSVHSTTPMNISSLALELAVDHPCNTIVMWSDFEFFKAVYEQGIPLPKVSTMPKKGYRLDKDENFALRFGVRYRDDGKLARDDDNMRSYFHPSYQWLYSNIIGTREEMMRRHMPNGTRPRKAEQRQSNTTSGGYTTFQTELEAELGDSFPIDGAVLYGSVTFRTYQKGSRGPSATIYTLTAVHFTADEYGLPVTVRSWITTTEKNKEYVQRLDVQESGKFNVITVGLNHNLKNRLVTFVSVGTESAPVVAAAKILSGDPIEGEIGKFKLVDQIFPGARIGAVGFAAFKVDMPLGSEEYYLFSASTGSDVTNTIVRMIEWIPVEVEVKTPNVYEKSNGTMEASCTVTGYPKPTMRLFLLPDNGIGFSTDEFSQNYVKYELTESTDLVDVTTISSDPLKKSVSFDWAPVVQTYDTYGFYLACLATNKYKEDFQSNYVYLSSFEYDWSEY